MTDEFELNARRLKIAQLLEAQSRDETRMAHLEKVHAQCAEQDISGRALLAQFQESGDVVWLKDELGTWGRQPGYFPYNGVNGQMFLNQVVNYSPDPDALGRLLMRCLAVPSSPEAATKSINDLAEYVSLIKRGAHPAPRRAIFFLSFFWSVQQHESWPCFWTSAEKMLYRLGWLESTDDLGQLYVRFRDVVLSVGDSDPIEDVLHYLEDEKFLGIDPSISERCRVNLELGDSMADGAYPDAESASEPRSMRAL